MFDIEKIVDLLTAEYFACGMFDDDPPDEYWKDVYLIAGDFVGMDEKDAVKAIRARVENDCYNRG